MSADPKQVLILPETDGQPNFDGIAVGQCYLNHADGTIWIWTGTAWQQNQILS